VAAGNMDLMINRYTAKTPEQRKTWRQIAANQQA
jgi:hypothetical protein